MSSHYYAFNFIINRHHRIISKCPFLIIEFKFFQLIYKAFIGINYISSTFNKFKSILERNIKTFHNIHNNTCSRSGSTHRTVNKHNIFVICIFIELVYLIFDLICYFIIPFLFSYHFFIIRNIIILKLNLKIINPN